MGSSPTRPTAFVQVSDLWLDMRGSVIQKPAGSGRWYVVLDLGRDGTGWWQQKWHSGYRS